MRCTTHSLSRSDPFNYATTMASFTLLIVLVVALHAQAAWGYPGLWVKKSAKEGCLAHPTTNGEVFEGDRRSGRIHRLMNPPTTRRG